MSKSVTVIPLPPSSRPATPLAGEADVLCFRKRDTALPTDLLPVADLARAYAPELAARQYADELRGLLRKDAPSLSPPDETITSHLAAAGLIVLARAKAANFRRLANGAGSGMIHCLLVAVIAMPILQPPQEPVPLSRDVNFGDWRTADGGWGEIAGEGAWVTLGGDAPSAVNSTPPAPTAQSLNWGGGSTGTIIEWGGTKPDRD